jgi:hypothetical protein
LFPDHIATVGECEFSSQVCDPFPILDTDASSMAVHSTLSMGLDFSFRSRFKSHVHRRFGSTVHPLGNSNHFLMVVLFRRAIQIGC